MNYLISIKASADSKPLKQQVVSDNGAFNIVRKAMTRLESMDESSADLKAMRFMTKVRFNNAKSIEDTRTGRVLVVQKQEVTSC